jgi:hypothetical protein
MKNPHVGQRVWAEKLTGTFVIVAVDEDYGFADIQSMNDVSAIQKHVPISLIHALGGDSSPTSRD